jgi:hypothetical protein
MVARGSGRGGGGGEEVWVVLVAGPPQRPRRLTPVTRKTAGKQPEKDRDAVSCLRDALLVQLPSARVVRWLMMRVLEFDRERLWDHF